MPPELLDNGTLGTIARCRATPSACKSNLRFLGIVFQSSPASGNQSPASITIIPTAHVSKRYSRWGKKRILPPAPPPSYRAARSGDLRRALGNPGWPREALDIQARMGFADGLRELIRIG